MVVETVETVLPPSLIEEIFSLITLFKAVSGTIIAYLIFQTVRIFLSKGIRDKLRDISRSIKSIDKRLKRVEKKIDTINNKKKK